MKRYRKRRRRYRKSLYSKVEKNRRAIKGIVKSQEKKAKTITITDGDVNDTGGYTYITNINRGDDDDERDGNVIYLKSIFGRIGLTNDHGTPEDCFVRMMLVCDKSANNVALDLADLLGTGWNIFSPINWDSKKKYKVYYDNMWAMDTSQHSYIPIKFRITNINKQVTYDNTDGGTDDARDNAFYLVRMSTVTGTTNDPLIDAKIRVTYYDS